MINKQQFKTRLDDLYELYGKDSPSPVVLQQWLDALQNYDMETIHKALLYLVKHDKFLPKPADVIGLIGQFDGRPTSDEAWAIAMNQSDEEASVTTNDEIMLALSYGASDLIAHGDVMAARLAFRDSYNRVVIESRDIGKPLKWWVSVGHNVSLRNDEIDKAEALGRISSDFAASKRISTDSTPEGGQLMAIAFQGITAKTDDEREKHKANIGKLRCIIVGK